MLVLPQVATAAAPVFSAPQEIATGGQVPQVVIGPTGDALVAWTGESGGIYVARRPVFGTHFSAPEKVADDHVLFMRIARNDRGDIAIAWSGPADPVTGAAQPRVATAAPGQSFADAVDVPMPSRGAPVLDNYNEMTRYISDPDVTVGADGTVAVGYGETDQRANLSRTIVVLRPPGAGFRAPQVLSTAEASPTDQGTSTWQPELAADGLGRLYAAWSTRPSDYPDGAATMLVAEAAAGQAFGGAHRISDGVAQTFSFAPRLVANHRGDVIAVWSSVRPGAPFFVMPDSASVVTRSADGTWSAPELLGNTGSTVLYASADLNERHELSARRGRLRYAGQAGDPTRNAVDGDPGRA